MSAPPSSGSLPENHPVATFARTWGARHGLVVVVGALTLASLIILMTPSIPLGVPGEWTWARRSWTEIDPLACFWSLLLCAGYWRAVQWGESRSLDPQVRASSRDIVRTQPSKLARTWGSRLRDVRLAGLCVLAFAWLFGMLCIQPDYQGIARSPTVLYYTRTEGYFHQAAFEVQNSREFLHSYRDTIASGDDPDRYLHLGTHPPGLTLAYRGLLVGFERYPRVAEALIAMEPSRFREGIAALRQFPTPRGQPLSPAEEATLWAATLLTLLAVAGACWPIYHLTLRMSDRVTAWRAAALWPLVPSLLVFFPKSDLLCPVIALTSCWLWLDGWSRFRWGQCVLAGAGFFCGLMLTLALAPVALLLVIQTGLERWTRREEFRDRRVWADVAAVLAAVVGFMVPLVGLSAWGGCNLFAIWMQNLSNHALFYAHNPRSFGAWLAVNPIEAAFSLGMPLACLVAGGAVRGVRQRLVSPLAFSQTVSWVSVWAILWLSGKNMGEAARLWIFLAPWPVMTAALGLQRPGVATLGLSRLDDVESQRIWKWILALQLLACLWTSMSVDGFHFAELLIQR